MHRAIIVLFSFFIFMNFTEQDWGFYGHRKINRYAVFTLPEDMLGFYKNHIEFMTEHAVDPDKRRYVLKTEATRHYIDIDVWDTIPFSNIPRNFEEAVFKYGSFVLLTSGNDTLGLSPNQDTMGSSPAIRRFIMEDRYSNEIEIPVEYVDKGNSLRDSISKVLFRNHLAENGVLPYFLEEFYERLVYSFESGNAQSILKISADIGHYISDAHVPLHTTINYNGDLSGQSGIHAFWESRLPELYAEDEYDFMVGKAEYIPDIQTYIWKTIEESHACVNTVLKNEKETRNQFPEARQMCYDIRNDINTYTQCREFSKVYHDSMNGMVEDRMRKSIHSIGSIWYSAWVDAGQPVLNNLEKMVLEENPIGKEQESIMKYIINRL